VSAAVAARPGAERQEGKTMSPGRALPMATAGAVPSRKMPAMTAGRRCSACPCPAGAARLRPRPGAVG